MNILRGYDRLMAKIKEREAQRNAVGKDLSIGFAALNVVPASIFALMAVPENLTWVPLWSIFASGLIFIAGMGMAVYNRWASRQPITPTGCRISN